MDDGHAPAIASDIWPPLMASPDVLQSSDESSCAAPTGCIGTLSLTDCETHARQLSEMIDRLSDVFACVDERDRMKRDTFMLLIQGRLHVRYG